MSTYNEEVVALTAWFEERLDAHVPFSMTEEEYQTGTDSLPPPFKGLVQEAGSCWLFERHYNLSYNQLCLAFFQAARNLRKFTLVPRHPNFPLHTRVIIGRVNGINCFGDAWEARDVPGVITSVNGDEHVVLITAPLCDKQSSRSGLVGCDCVVIHTNELDIHLRLA